MYVFNLSTRGKITFRKCVTRNAPEKKLLVYVFYGASLCCIRIASRTYSNLVCDACGPSNAECIGIIEKMSWVTWYAPDLLVTWVCRAITKHRPYHANDTSKVFFIYVRWSLFDPQKMAHDWNKSFSTSPLNVWFRVAVQQITWYRSRSAYWLLIEGSIRAHRLMTLYGLKKIIYADVSAERRRCSFYTLFSFRK